MGYKSLILLFLIHYLVFFADKASAEQATIKKDRVWVVVIFVYGKNKSNDLVIECWKEYESKLECNKSRLDSKLLEVVRGYYRLNWVNNVNHDCVQIPTKKKINQA